jgi:hypothetical protein
LHQPFHDGDLVEACGQEESRKFRQALLAEVAAAVEIVATRHVASGQMTFVGGDVAREAARDRPDRAGVERVQQRCMRHQPRDATIAVKERVNPREAVMGRRRTENGLGLAEAAINLLEALSAEPTTGSSSPKPAGSLVHCFEPACDTGQTQNA